MNLKRILRAIWVLLLLPGGVATAEPNDITAYLMNEPVSVMDFGMYRLDRRVREVMESEHKAIGGARYDWESNKIILTGFSSDRKAKNIEGARLKCKEMMNSLRYVLGVNADTGQSIFGSSSMIDQYFVHMGYKKALQPENLADKLVQLVEIQTLVSTDGGDKLKCSGPLLGTVIYFSK